MKKVLFSAMALMMGLMMLVSCNKEKQSSKEAVFTADIEQLAGQQGRTAINPENGMVKWLAGDKIMIANDEGETATFTLQSGAGTTNGTFRTTGEFEMSEPFVAVYPQTATLNGTTATFNLPAIQTLTQTGTFANGANPMAAYAEDENLFFMNLCGGLDVRLLGDNIHVSGIRITGSESEKLNGNFTVDCSANEPALMANQGTNGTNIVTLNCDVTLTSTTTPQEFFIVLPVGALAQGFTMEVLDGEEVICTKQLETNLAQIVRNDVKRFNPLLIGETPTPIELPDVVTHEVTGITTTTAIAGGEIISDGGSAITECGVCWSTEGEPTLEGDHATATATTGAFTVSLTGLTQNTTYYIRAYATNEAGTGYGEVLTFTTQEEIQPTDPTVTTEAATAIEQTTATLNATITNPDNVSISAKGFEWKATVGGAYTLATVTSDNFSYNLTNLTPNTGYTFKAFITFDGTTVYGEEVNFTTLEEIIITVPTVTTNEVTDITTNSALVGGQITGAGNGTISESGICYKTGTEDWTCVALEATNNAFSMTLSGLTANTTYTVRAYATNEEGTGYGDEVTFTTIGDGPTPPGPQGIINGAFTINDNGDQVYFSQGNLQYNKTTNEWSFMEHQYDMVETQGQNVGENYANQNIVSLFGWGTSGYNHGAVAYQPWCTSISNNDYYAYGNSQYNLYNQTGQADWGYNAISNGGNQENCGWRTLTQPEWNYVFNTRTTASGIRYVKANVNGVNGMILLPDNWTTSIYTLNNPNPSIWHCYFSDNIITAVDWTDSLEANGAVFLPASGIRNGSEISDIDYNGFYWSSSNANYQGRVIFISFNSTYHTTYGDSNRYSGVSVRLVRSVE